MNVSKYFTPDAFTEGPFDIYAIGFSHRCMTNVGSGPVFCRGTSDLGQLGIGSMSGSSNQSGAVVGITDVKSLASGAYHACAVTSDGGVVCWGHNDSGQLGDSTMTDRSTPVVVSSAESFATVSAGYYHTCALTNGGDVFCWGSNLQGQLGTSVSSIVPTQVLGLPASAVSVSAGQYHTCALLVDGRIACWGRGDEGQLGDGLKTTSSTPVIVK